MYQLFNHLAPALVSVSFTFPVHALVIHLPVRACLLDAVSSCIFPLSLNPLHVLSLPLLVVVLTCPTMVGYTFEQGVYVDNGGAAQIINAYSVCSADPLCVAYNSNGFPKTTISPLLTWQSAGPCDGLYIKIGELGFP